jgi:AmmeMemoRadiSam system protein A
MEAITGMMTGKVDPSEQDQLLRIARQALEASVNGKPLPALPMAELPPSLTADGASFVTLTIHGQLRGCIGALQAYKPLAKDVQEHAMAAAMQDFRFPQVRPAELPTIEIEVSILTPAEPLDYDGPEDLVRKLKPGEDGLVLADGFRKATFLPAHRRRVPLAPLFENGRAIRPVEEKAPGRIHLSCAGVSRVICANHTDGKRPTPNTITPH